MTEDEIHDFGIEIVANQLIKEGHELVDVNSDPDQNPQIVAQLNGQLAFITVRTAVYPRDGEIKDQALVDNLINHAKNHSAVPYLASVSIANSKGYEHGDENEIGIPIRGEGYYANYRGLKIIAHVDQIKIASDGKVRDFVPNEKIVLSRKALHEAMDFMRRDLGDVDDLPIEVVNTLANVYYRFFALQEHMNSGGTSRLIEPFMPPASDALTDFKNFNQLNANTLSAIKLAKKLVQAARLTRSQNPKLFPYTATLMLDVLKYNIENANSKSIIRRFIEREFWGKSYEIANFYERALKADSEFKENNVNRSL